jgi:hypothetical protein
MNNKNKFYSSEVLDENTTWRIANKVPKKVDVPTTFSSAKSS